MGPEEQKDKTCRINLAERIWHDTSTLFGDEVERVFPIGAKVLLHGDGKSRAGTVHSYKSIPGRIVVKPDGKWGKILFEGHWSEIELVGEGLEP